MFDSSISKEQADFLLSREQQGGFCCVAYGATAAKAIVEWLYKGKPLGWGLDFYRLIKYLLGCCPPYVVTYDNGAPEVAAAVVTVVAPHLTVIVRSTLIVTLKS